MEAELDICEGIDQGALYILSMVGLMISVHYVLYKAAKYDWC